jgi:hypothetical protein
MHRFALSARCKIKERPARFPFGSTIFPGEAPTARPEQPQGLLDVCGSGSGGLSGRMARNRGPATSHRAFKLAIAIATERLTLGATRHHVASGYRASSGLQRSQRWYHWVRRLCESKQRDTNHCRGLISKCTERAVDSSSTVYGFARNADLLTN